jgi:hypothetical protein
MNRVLINLNIKALLFILCSNSWIIKQCEVIWFSLLKTSVVWYNYIRVYIPKGAERDI